MTILVAGCGWLGRAVGVALVARGDRVVGVTRSGANAGTMEGRGIEPHRCDLNDPSDLARLPADDAGSAVRQRLNQGPAAGAAR